MKELSKKFISVILVALVLALFNVWPFQFKDQFNFSGIIGFFLLFFIADWVYKYYLER